MCVCTYIYIHRERERERSKSCDKQWNILALGYSKYMWNLFISPEVQGGEPALSLSPQFCPRAALVPASSGCSSQQFGPNLTAQGIREERWKVFETSAVTQTETWKLFVDRYLTAASKLVPNMHHHKIGQTCHTNKYDLSALTVYSSIHKYSQIFTKNNSNAPGVSNFSHTSIIFSPLSRLRLVQFCSVGRFLPFYTLVNLGVSWFVKKNKTW